MWVTPRSSGTATSPSRMALVTASCRSHSATAAKRRVASLPSLLNSRTFEYSMVAIMR
jgi:hypothetical protein